MWISRLQQMPRAACARASGVPAHLDRRVLGKLAAPLNLLPGVLLACIKWGGQGRGLGVAVTWRLASTWVDGWAKAHA